MAGFKRGLTLGKFAPLHRGHQWLIETGLSEMDEMLVIIYDAPETIPIPLVVRSGWIRALYPTARVIEAWDGPTEVGYTPALMRGHERYVIDALGVRGVTHFYSSDLYGEHMSQALGAIDQRVDENRERFPISAGQRMAPPGHYADKVDWTHRDPAVFSGVTSPDPDILLQTAVVYVPRLCRRVRGVVVRRRTQRIALLFSTALDLDPVTLYRSL